MSVYRNDSNQPREENISSGYSSKSLNEINAYIVLIGGIIAILASVVTPVGAYFALIGSIDRIEQRFNTTAAFTEEKIKITAASITDTMNGIKEDVIEVKDAVKSVQSQVNKVEKTIAPGILPATQIKIEKIEDRLREVEKKY